MELLALVLAAGIDWAPWSADTLDRARRDARPVLLVVGADDPCLADGALAEVLTDLFVAVKVDAAERPDLADVARLAATLSSDADPPRPAAAVWAVFTPSLHPIAAGDLEGRSPAGLAAHLSSIAADYAEHRADVEARAGVAAARLAGAQVPEAPQGPLDAASIGRALAGIRDGGAPTPGSIRLLLAEAARSPTPATRAELARAVTAYLRSQSGDTLADKALRLRVLADGYAATGLQALRDAAEAAANGLLEERDAEGRFLDGGAGARVFAFENGLAIGALVASSSALGRAADRDAATKAASATLARLGPWPALARCASAAGSCGGAFLEDYAFFAEALLDLHDSTGEAGWRDEARSAVDAALARFLDTSAGGFFETDAAHEPLPARLKSGYDGARPSPNGVMASVLVRLARATGEKRYADLARGTLDAFRGDLQRAPRGMETMAASAVPLVGPTAGAAPDPPRPSLQTRGPVTVEVILDRSRARAGEKLEARVRLTATSPWTLSGHGPGTRGLVPLSVSVPGDRFSVGPVTYPPEATIAQTALVVVPLRVRADTPAGPVALRLTVRFQRCRGAECQAPESLILEAPLAVEAPGP
jgi:uncharacterized protein YyaL (SSP411 family)